uniref:Bm11762 n=1 Tax=Brugia malayi TaxID=6279 RepID=A0A1I9GDA3_BRUMA|nr:Bm11762 [Brugia malayi]
MLTRQNKCHAAYFFNTRVSPDGFLRLEVCAVLGGVDAQKAKLKGHTHRGDSPEALPGNSSSRDRLTSGESEVGESKVGSTLARTCEVPLYWLRRSSFTETGSCSCAELMVAKQCCPTVPVGLWSWLKQGFH